jgi:hypothetical protein
MKLFALWFVPPIFAALMAVIFGVGLGWKLEKWLATLSIPWFARFLIIAVGTYLFARLAFFMSMPNGRARPDGSLIDMFFGLFAMALSGAVWISVLTMVLRGLVYLIKR